MVAKIGVVRLTGKLKEFGKPNTFKIIPVSYTHLDVYKRQILYKSDYYNIFITTVNIISNNCT